MEDKESGKVVSCVTCYFMCQDGSMFKAQVEHAPYFFLHVKVRPGRLHSGGVVRYTLGCLSCGK
jgi:hypothetical protein